MSLIEDLGIVCEEVVDMTSPLYQEKLSYMFDEYKATQTGSSIRDGLHTSYHLVFEMHAYGNFCNACTLNLVLRERLAFYHYGNPNTTGKVAEEFVAFLNQKDDWKGVARRLVSLMKAVSRLMWQPRLDSPDFRWWTPNAVISTYTQLVAERQAIMAPPEQETASGSVNTFWTPCLKTRHGIQPRALKCTEAVWGLAWTPNGQELPLAWN
eukprot:s884_g18.t1